MIDTNETPVTFEDVWAAHSDIIQRRARSTGARLGQQHAGYVDAADCEQEALAWVIEHPQLVHDWLSNEPKTGPAKLGTAMWRAGNKHATRQRRLVDGTDATDYVTFTPLLVAEVLPDALDKSFDGTPGQSATDYDAPKGKTDPAKGNTYLATVVDVRVGLGRISDEDRLTLVTRFCPGGSVALVTEAYGLSEDAAVKRVRRALERLAAALGGQEYSPFTGRRAESNAAARARLERQYE